MPTSSRRSDSGPRRVRAAVQKADEPQAPTPAGHAVCEHLLPLLQRLVHAHGLRLVERADGLGSGLGFLFDAELPLEELAALPRPEFVHVIASRGLIFCERCWQSLGEWKLHKDAWN
jgi:hypothetical protein